MIGHNLAFLLSGGPWRGVSHLPAGPRDVPADFFGIAVASSPDPACDDYLVARLGELGVRCVRLDLPSDGSAPHALRLLGRLSAAGFRVMLHAVQAGDEAARMGAAEARESWRRFLAGTLDAAGGAIEMLEAGSTVNRRSWCRYTMPGFLAAWEIAFEECRRRGVTLAGPNVTDFEPIYNIGLLGVMRRAGRLPDVHTTNLFAERAIEPERFDHKLGGWLLGRTLRFNLVRKASWLAAIGRRNGVGRTFSTHAAWSRRRIDRILPDTAEKQADYLARYCCLAAASGSLDRIYWGPLIGQREGLIDDGTQEHPELPHVFCYALARGQVSGYAIRPAFAAFRTAAGLLAGARYERSIATAGGLEIHEFSRGGRTMHAAWTLDGCLAPLAGIYGPAALAGASFLDRDGRELPAPPEAAVESPVYILWPAGTRPELRAGAPAAPLPGVRVSLRPGTRPRQVAAGRWTGMYMAAEGEGADAFRALLPEALESAAGREVLRDVRNTVWSCPDPRNPARTIVVKRRRAGRSLRKVLESWRPSRGRRAWNASHELLRRGIPAARPIAFFESAPGSFPRESYYVCEAFATDCSVRQAFAALAKGEPAFRGIPAESVYRQVAAFVENLHDRGVFFRDLSPGNLLMRPAGGESIDLCLIDTARARFSERHIPEALRQRDLVRLLRPLPVACREQFLTHRGGPGRCRLGLRARLQFAIFDMKRAGKSGRRKPPPAGE